MKRDAMKNIGRQIRKIRIFMTDVDGVLTDGKIVLDSRGNELKAFSVLDGAAVKYAALLGFKTVIISGRRSQAVAKRGKELGVFKVFQGARDKLKIVNEILRKEGIKKDEVCYVGDDLADMSAMRNAGLSVAVNNAVGEVKSLADYVTVKKGGEGAFREVVELVFKGQGRWKELLKKFDEE